MGAAGQPGRRAAPARSCGSPSEGTHATIGSDEAGHLLFSGGATDMEPAGEASACQYSWMGA